MISPARYASSHPAETPVNRQNLSPAPLPRARQTVLHYACMGGSPLLVTVLLTCGCLHQTRSKAGLMAIDVARMRRREDLCTVIAKHVNRHPDHLVRMEFASMLFPKGGQVTGFDVDGGDDVSLAAATEDGGTALATVEEGDGEGDKADEHHVYA